MDSLFLQIEEVKGESKIKGFEDSIELLSFSHGVAMQVIGAAGMDSQRTSGRPNHQDLTISKYFDISTCPLVDACNRGTVYKKITLTVARNDNEQMLPYLIYELTNAIVSSNSISGGGGDRPTETITLNYSGIKWDFTSQKEEGGKKGHNGASWDMTTNTGALAAA